MTLVPTADLADGPFVLALVDRLSPVACGGHLHLLKEMLYQGLECQTYYQSAFKLGDHTSNKRGNTQLWGAH